MKFTYNVFLGKFHQIYQNWMYDSVETDKKYRDVVVDDYFSIMNKKNHIVLDILISLVEQEHNDICKEIIQYFLSIFIILFL